MTLNGAWANRRRLVGTGFAVLLGVAFLAATLVLTGTLRADVGQTIARANAGIDAVVRGQSAFGSDLGAQRALVDRALLQDVRGVAGVATAVGAVEGLTQIIGAEGRAVGGNGRPRSGSAGSTRLRCAATGSCAEEHRRRPARSPSTSTRRPRADWRSATPRSCAPRLPSRSPWSACSS